MASITSDTGHHHERGHRMLKSADCDLHRDGRDAVVLWVTPAARTPLCETCMHVWWDFARTNPWMLPTGLIPLVPAACRCGHGIDIHTHLRAGSDCSRCDCARYRRTLTGWLGDLRLRMSTR